VQSFGFGGANSHVILDDAYNFLCLRELKGNHNSVSKPPENLDSPLDALALNLASRDTRTASRSKPTGQDDTSSLSIFPQVLVWSTADRSGIGRVTEVWRDYFARIHMSDVEKSAYLSDLAYTLATRRSRLPWGTFGVTKDKENPFNVIDQMWTPIPARTSPKLAFIFTGACTTYPILDLRQI
jgi:acyl transferase domain-containing protein